MRQPSFIPSLLALIHVPASAATFLAAPGPGNSAIHLRQAINDANANPGPDTVVVAAGNYEIESPGSDDNGSEGDLDISDDLVIQGAGAGSTFLDGAGIARLLDIHGPSAVTMSGLTLRNGDDSEGGAIRISDGSLVASGCEILGSRATRGGGIYAFDSSVELIDCVVGENSVSPGTSAQGGGIYYRDETGGGLLKITGSIIRGNSATDDGGGIENYEGNVEITRSTVRGNSSGDDGGGIENDNHADGGFLTVCDCAFLENTAVNGGAIDNDGIATLVNTTITGNTATGTDEQGWGSGGIRVSEDSKSGTSLTLTHCTLFGNLAQSDGASPEAGDIGNVSTKGARIEIQNSIVGSGYTDLTLSSGVPGSMRSRGSNIFEDDSGFNKTLESGAPADLVADPALDLLCDNGLAGHAHLTPLAGSPAIDGGNDSSGPSLDQLGQARIDGDNDGSVLPDIGAVESPGVLFETWRALRFDPAQRADCGISGPHADPDGDSRENLGEFQGDTDPLSGSSFLRAIAGVGGVTIPDSSTARSYTLLRSPDLDEIWTPVLGPVPGNGGDLILADPEPAGTRCFYRVSAALP